MNYPAWLTARREAGDREIGDAFVLMGALGLAGCVLGSLLLLLILGPFERPDPVPIDYVFRQRWTWINELGALFIAPFPATCGGVLLAREIAERRQLLPPFGNVDWSRVSAFGERLAMPPVAGASIGLFAGMIAGRLLATRTLRAAGYEGMPYGPLRAMRAWLVGLPIVSAAAALVVNEMQNPDRIFELTLPIVLGVLVGLAFALLVVGARLRDSPIPVGRSVSPGSGSGSACQAR